MIDRRKEQELVRDVIRCNRIITTNENENTVKKYQKIKEQKLKELAELEGVIEDGEKEKE